MMATTNQLTARPSVCSTSCSCYSATSTSTTRRPSSLVLTRTKSYAENSCILALLLGGARDVPVTRHPTRINPSSPSLSQTGGSGRSVVGIPTSAPSAAPFLPSLNSHHVPRNPLEWLFLHHRCNWLYKPEHFHFRLRWPHKHDWNNTWLLNPALCVALTVQNTSSLGAGGGPVFVASSLNTCLTAAVAPARVNPMSPRETASWVGLHEG